MAQNENESLAALEHLMDEFFAMATSNVRKHDIESQLNAFSSQQESWRLCVYFFRHTANQYVSMYALSTIESVINRQWNCIDWEHRVQLKGALYEFYTDQSNATPTFIRNKLAKLLVDIARNDWPHFYPDFFSNIIQLLQSDNGQLLGIVLLRTTSEELMSPRPDLTSFRKEELSRLMHQHIPQIFQILTAILNAMGNKKKRYTTTTPPPSPTHPSSAPNLAQQISAASFKPDSNAIVREALATAQHLFSWAEMTQIPVQLIDTIYKFNSLERYITDDEDMCVPAMSALNELLYRKLVPHGCQDLFVHIFHHTVLFMKDLNTPTNGKYELLGPDFCEKISEILSLLIETHLWRLEADPNFSSFEFFAQLYQLTMQPLLVDCYLRFLSVWAVFLKQIKSHNAHKYSEVVLGLLIAVLNKMQFQTNEEQLNEITCDREDSQAEWQSFQKTTIEIIAMIAEFAPLETFTRVMVPWEEANEIFYTFESESELTKETIVMPSFDYIVMHRTFKDLSTLTQTLARLSVFFIDQQDTEYYHKASPLIDRLLLKVIQSACLTTKSKYYHYKIKDTKINDDLIEIHIQFLSALKTWWPWLNTNANFGPKEMKQLMDLGLLPLIKEPTKDPPQVTAAASHLFLTITSSVYPPNLILIPSIIEFLQTAPTTKYLNKKNKEVILCGFTALLLKPWGELSQSDSNKRNELIGLFFDRIAKDFRECSPNTVESKLKEICYDVLPCFSSILEYSKNLPLNSKKMLFMAVKPSIEHALMVLPSYAFYPEINELLLVFFLNALSVLQQQMGVVLVKQAVETFLQVAIRGHEKKDLAGMDKLLQILQLVVESPSNAYKNFLQGIIELCLKNIFPAVIVEASTHPDMMIALLNLLHSILLNRWNYFYLSQIRLGNSPGCSDIEPCADSPQQPEQLLAILQVFGQSLLQPDINTFRTSLQTLENLNTKWKLYHKALFREQVLCQFLTVLLQTLLDKSQNLLNDDIILALYNMASVSFQAFFSTFLHQFIDNMEGLTQQQRHTLKQNFLNEIDMPTFVLQVQRFINDMRCFRLCNASLPPGSVAL